MTTPSSTTTSFESPAGWIEIVTGPLGVQSLMFRETMSGPEPPDPLAAECIGQLRQYFAGERRNFTLPLAPSGTPFQLRVWDELLKIPYGQVITYRELAKRIGGATYTRIVGQANAKNPVSILIPCHRVIGMNGALTGYAGGLWRKKILLELEQKGGHADFSPTLFENNP
jgi:methylated-DNA-[protein]-cysteine S-methyltransferase